MRVRVFASLREIVGEPYVEAEGQDVGELIDDLGARFGPEFARIVESGTVVVNGETAASDQPLRPDDDVALLPPVSGG